MKMRTDIISVGGEPGTVAKSEGRCGPLDGLELVSDLAGRLGCCPRTILRRIRQKALRGVKLFGRWYVHRDSLDAYVKGGGDWRGHESEQRHGSKPTRAAGFGISTDTIPMPGGSDARALVRSIKSPRTRR